MDQEMERRRNATIISIWNKHLLFKKNLKAVWRKFKDCRDRYDLKHRR